MHREFIEDEIESGQIIEVPSHNHMVNVLRMSLGDRFEIASPSGLFEGELIEADGQLMVKVLEPIDKDGESPIKITLYQSLCKKDKFEHVIQKSIELGVHKIVPVSTRRTVVKLDGKKKDKKLDRYRKIAESAAAQSKRAYIPEVGDLVGLDQVDASKLLVAYEEEGQGLKESLKSSDGEEISILIGPEGGLGPQEVTLLESKGARLVNFGKRILRTETAGPFLISAIQYELGDMG